MSEQLHSDVEISVKCGIKKQCLRCAKIRGKIINMVLDKLEHWYKCPKCKSVRPVNTQVPLYWTYCPNFWRDDAKVKVKKVVLNIYKFFKCICLRKKFIIIPFTTWCLYPKLITSEDKGTLLITCANCSHVYMGA